MPNMRMTKNEMPVQDADIRNSNFLEVALGYTAEQAIDEANRCLNCKNKPCVGNCPVHIDIPEFIEHIKCGEFEAAYRVIEKSSSLSAICGRVCPQETQCEMKCVRGIKGEPVAIGRLERFVADYCAELDTEVSACKKNENAADKNGHKVAIIGSGPAGLSCAGELLKRGYDVTVFEALHLAGGVLVYGIPEFRLPKEIVRREVDKLKRMGAAIETNVVIGKTVSVDELFDEYGYEAVFIGTGAGLPKFMGIPGENLNGVYSANEFLTRINLMKAYDSGSTTPIYCGKRVVVVGGGNVAMDAARCAKRLGAEVNIVYRRTQKELPARREEVEHALEEGIELTMLTSPVKIEGNEQGWVKSVELQRMRLSEPDASGRARPVPIEDSNFSIDANCVIMAIGTSPNPLIKSTTKGLVIKRGGGIEADEATGRTSREGVYAGGDAVTGTATVILAMGAGKNAAAAIDGYIMGK